MNPSAISEKLLVDLESGSTETRPNRRRWWKALTRSGRPRRLGRRRMMESMHADHLRLVATLDRISERLEGPADRSAQEADPTPVFEGIRNITIGQQRIGSALESLEGMLERGFETDTKLASAVESIDRTLVEVRGGHVETVAALERVGGQVDDSTRRFEQLFLRMEETERQRVLEFRKLKNRAMLGFAGIATAAIAAVAVIMTSPWG